MLLLDGRVVAQTRRLAMGPRVLRFRERAGRDPGLAVILIGDDPASEVYVRNKVAGCKEVGIRSEEHRLVASVAKAEVTDLIHRLNEDNKVDGILLQLPVPKHLPSDELVELIRPEKDPDGLTMANLGRLLAGRPRSISCTPLGVMKILEHYKIPVAGRHAVVIGRSNIVGKPMAQLLLAADATVTICHSRTKDLTQFSKQADLVVVAAGKPEFLGREAFKKGAVVIDVGIHRKPAADGKNRLCGDVKSEELKDWVEALTPVPGGVGPMTITMLLENTLMLAEQSLS